MYRSADKSLARPTSRCIFLMVRIFLLMLVLLYILNITNISSIMIINRLYRGADKFLARPTTRCILLDGENISFDASLVIYIYI